MHRVAIAGGGIGGLTAAIALQRRGVEAHVFEAAEALRAVGAGIWVPTNAMQVLARLGLAEEVRAEGARVRRAEVRDFQHGLLQTLDLAGAEARFGHGTIAVHRARLQAVLVRHLAPGTLHLGKALRGCVQEGERVRAHLTDGTEVQTDVLVGADGLRSAVREALFPGAPLRDSGQSSYRAVVPYTLPRELEEVGWEVWGPGCRFGFSGVGHGEVYWYATFDAPAGQRDAAREARRRLEAMAALFPFPIPALIAATPEEALTRTDLLDLRPLRTWHGGRVVLLGDAAHASTPNLGQGGAQAIEDAWVLARELSGHARPEEAFVRYTRARLPKARQVVERSWQLGRVVHVSHPLARALRTLLLRLTPAVVGRRQLEALYTVEE